ncbi:amidohydrolase, partial [Mariniblastus sp.]|nr:amidohydrolase [Mariniblastus sp.]
TGTFKLPDDQAVGVHLFSVMFTDDETGIGQLTSPQGKVSEFTLEPVDEWAREVKGHQHNKPTDEDKSETKPTDDADSEKSEEGDVDDVEVDKDDEASNDAEKEENVKTEASGKPNLTESSPSVSFPVNYPLGAYGVTALPDLPESVLIKNVTIWTLDEKGKIDNGAILFGDGKIQSIFDLESKQPLPDADMVIDGEGGHVTPGIIDCHSHMATDSGVNESGQAITAEVRIGDMIDPDDITIYRQLAGGVTSSNILHGSANPIGGQNQVIKLRWGGNEEDLKFADAPLGIKFALGENVKQSNWSTPTNRYPQTRMGVEQLIDDALRSAEDYRRRHEDYRRDRVGLPPRRDLELDALVEICEGKRWIHCHSYRQDEILALIRTLESHDIQIGSFQHILEGYKVADEMAKHGATASSFADWWAYKYEVKDAIPYAGSLMHDSGLVVSFNSDDHELGRRLNQEAAKAVRYGGVDEVEALKFVTLNPAKQLRIDDKVGSLEPGKDADLVLWSGDPLSNLSRVQQTWVDGRKYFDISEDLKRRKENQRQRNVLIQKILTSGAKMEAKNKDTTDPAKLWPRYDEFCGHHDHRDDHDDGSDHLHGGRQTQSEQQSQQGASHE